MGQWTRLLSGIWLKNWHSVGNILTYNELDHSRLPACLRAGIN
jgi:hypothetical protein